MQGENSMFWSSKRQIQKVFILFAESSANENA